MANLKEIRNRIASTINTQQVTSAMKLVSAAKLRRAQEQIFAARPYAFKIHELISTMQGRIDPDTHPSRCLRERTNAPSPPFSMPPIVPRPSSPRPGA